MVRRLRPHPRATHGTSTRKNAYRPCIWTLDGKVFDSSVKRGEPATFPLGSLIKGWQEYVPGMKVGGIRLMELPAAFAYGAAGSPPDIPPNATLVFEIEVLGAR